MSQKTALVLSGGGMFGAYQAGAWKVLADIFEPDLVVGASIGAVNGWAIAGGCPAGDLIRRWTNLEDFREHRWRWPRAIHGGIIDSSRLREQVYEVCSLFRPKIDYALVVTELPKLTPRIFTGDRVTPELLLASTAILGIFEQVRIEGTLYSDGGLLGALPLWAAAELGARRIVGINVLPVTPGIAPWLFVKTIRLMRRFRPDLPADAEVITLAPPRGLGSAREMLYWNRENVDRWIAQGENDAAAAKHSIQNCFERQ